MKTVVAILLLGASLQASALEVEGVKLADTMQVEKATLQLNGAGLRSIFGLIKVYVAALYLDGKKTTAEAVMSDSGAKRVELHVVADEASSERFLNGLRKGIEKNCSEAEMAALRERVDAFVKAFDPIKTARNGDVIAFDWLPGLGTRISMNGKELARIEGEDFYRALLSVWMGEHPVTDSLKKELLGG